VVGEEEGCEMSDHIPDLTKMVSDTPRTDENEFDWVTASFARKLERQLNAANERIKRLEEAGDVLCAAAAFMGWHMEIEKWNKSKEAKP